METLSKRSTSPDCIIFLFIFIARSWNCLFFTTILCQVELQQVTYTVYIIQLFELSPPRVQFSIQILMVCRPMQSRCQQQPDEGNQDK
jgi:hypothetical protein